MWTDHARIVAVEYDLDSVDGKLAQDQHAHQADITVVNAKVDTILARQTQTLIAMLGILGTLVIGLITILYGVIH